MMTRNVAERLLLTFALTVLTVMAVPDLLAAGADLARVEMDPSTVVWTPHVASDLVLTISGPAGVFRYEFEAGSAPFFESMGVAGQALPNGTYVYELRAPVKLTEADRKGRAKVRRSGLAMERPGPARRFQSGSLAVSDGLFVLAQPEELAEVLPRPAAIGQLKDQLISDDLIVQKSICGGADCVDNESFGFDTLRLKENNVRIKFDDTSTSPNYPKRDWQITINENTSQGAEKFSIEDLTHATIPFTIQGEAPSHALYVDQAGRVGFGTSTPTDSLHTITGNEPSLRLEQDGSQGFQAQTWAVGGNEGHFFVEDVSNSSAKPFRVRAGAPNSSLDIHSSGRVGIATSNPGHQLEVFGLAGDPEASLKVSNSGEAMVLLENRDLPSGNEWTISVTDNKLFEIAGDSGGLTMDGGGEAEFTGNVKANGILLTSDRHRKTDFRGLQGGQILDALADVPVSNWVFKSDARGVRHIGPMAQDFHRAFGVGPDEWHISPMDLGGVALAAIQELHQQMQDLLERNAELEARLAELERPRQ